MIHRRLHHGWLLFIVVCSIAFSCFAVEYSSLWGQNGELWSDDYATFPANRLADVSHAGYRGGEQPIPDYPVSVNVLDYGAVAGDGLDDSAAFQAAIAACAANGAVYIPEGFFTLTNTVVIDKANIVLRGAGTGKTIVEPLRGMLAFEIEGNAGNLSTYTYLSGIQRGDTSIVSSSLANKTAVGEMLWIRKYFTAGTPEYDDFLLQRIGGEETTSFSANTKVIMYAKVTAINGSVVSFDRPWEYSHFPGSPNWPISPVDTTTSDSGIEDLTIAYSPDDPFRQHFNGTEPGLKDGDNLTLAVSLGSTINCWVRNLHVKECTGGVSVSTRSIQNTITDVTLDAVRMSQSEFPLDGGLDFNEALGWDTPLDSDYWDCRGHHAVSLAGSYNLAENVRIGYISVHDITINDTENCVYSNVQGPDLSFDHHRRHPSRNLWTDIDAGLGRKLWFSTGNVEDGIRCGVFDTFWNVKTALKQSFPAYEPFGTGTFSHGYLNLVGLNMLDATDTNGTPRWIEADIAPGEIAQPNLYKAMRIKRFAGNGWDSVPPVAVAAANTAQGRGSLAVSFTGSSSSDNVGVVSHLWNFGDGYSSRLADPSHTYTVPGIYTATLTVRDARNLLDSAELEITVLESDALYDINYTLSGSARLQNYGLGTAHMVAGATNQIVAEGTAASTVIAVPASGYQFAGWSDGVKTAARTESNVVGSIDVVAYFMEGSSSSFANRPYGLAIDANTISESATHGAWVGTVTASDPDAGETFTFGLLDDAGGRFAIDALSGAITVADAASILHASDATHSITVLVADSTSDTYSKTFTVIVESATAPTAYAQSVSMVANGDAGIRLTGSDPESDPLTYTVTQLPTHGTLSGSAPNLIYAPALDYTGADSFSFKVNDGSVDSTEATVSIRVAAPLGASTELLVNGSFEDGASNFDFTGNAGDIALEASMDGSWIVRDSNEDSYMDLADASGEVSGQDGGKSMMFQSTNMRGLMQLVDVSEFDIDGMELDFSALFAAPGREGLNYSEIGAYQVIGFDDFTDVSVDVGGAYAFGGTTYDVVVAKRILADSDVSNSAYTPFNETVVFGHDYNYLAVVLGGLASAANDDTMFIGLDAVQLVLNSLETNTAPVAVEDSFSVEQNGSAAILLSASDTDGDTLVYIISEAPTNGTLSGIAPNLTYTPNVGYTGPDSFSFYVNDGSSNSASALVSIAVQPEVDTDGDGLTDAQEIALGTDPNDPDSGFGIDGLPLPIPGKIQVTWPSASGVLYKVWKSPDMVDWTVARDWTNALTPPVDTLEVDLTPSNGFFKVEAEIQ